MPAFGVTIQDFNRLREVGCVMVDTTCGSVLNVWKRVDSYARDGYTVTHGQARGTVQKLAELKDDLGFAQTFLVDGKPPEEGTKLRQAKWADTLEQLAHAGLDDFYRGDVAHEMAADLERLGSPLTRGDLRNCRAAIEEPLSVTLEGCPNIPAELIGAIQVAESTGNWTNSVGKLGELYEDGF